MQLCFNCFWKLHLHIITHSHILIQNIPWSLTSSKSNPVSSTSCSKFFSGELGQNFRQCRAIFSTSFLLFWQFSHIFTPLKQNRMWNYRHSRLNLLWDNCHPSCHITKMQRETNTCGYVSAHLPYLADLIQRRG
jgi:hypothetical protein